MAFSPGGNDEGLKPKAKMSRREAAWLLVMGLAGGVGAAVGLGGRLNQTPPVKDPALADEDAKIRKDMAATEQAKNP